MFGEDSIANFLTDSAKKGAGALGEYILGEMMVAMGIYDNQTKILMHLEYIQKQIDTISATVESIDTNVKNLIETVAKNDQKSVLREKYRRLQELRWDIDLSKELFIRVLQCMVNQADEMEVLVESMRALSALAQGLDHPELANLLKEAGKQCGQDIVKREIGKAPFSYLAAYSKRCQAILLMIDRELAANAENNLEELPIVVSASVSSAMAALESLKIGIQSTDKACEKYLEDVKGKSLYNRTMALYEDLVPARLSAEFSQGIIAVYDSLVAGAYNFDTQTANLRMDFRADYATVFFEAYTMACAELWIKDQWNNTSNLSGPNGDRLRQSVVQVNELFNKYAVVLDPHSIYCYVTAKRYRKEMITSYITGFWLHLKEDVYDFTETDNTWDASMDAAHMSTILKRMKNDITLRQELESAGFTHMGEARYLWASKENKSGFHEKTDYVFGRKLTVNGKNIYAMDVTTQIGPHDSVPLAKKLFFTHPFEAEIYSGLHKNKGNCYFKENYLKFKLWP